LPLQIKVKTRLNIQLLTEEKIKELLMKYKKQPTEVLMADSQELADTEKWYVNGSSVSKGKYSFLRLKTLVKGVIRWLLHK